MSPNMFLLLSFLLAVHSSQAKLKPKDVFTLCKRPDEGIADCINKASNQAKSHLLSGVADLHFLPLDPLFIPKMEIKQGKDNFKLDFTMSNITLYGSGDIKFLDHKADADLNWFNYTALAKTVLMESDYDMKGKVLILPVQGSGRSIFNLENVKMIGNVNFEYFDKKGEKYFRVKTYDVQIIPENLRMNFTNLFNGDKQLGDSANRFFNEHWRELYDTIKELQEQGLGELFKQYLNRAFTRLPLKDWFVE